MAKRKKLSDFYVTTSDPISFSDGIEETVVVLVKPNDIENAEAVRKANAARASVMINGEDPESEVYRETWSNVEESTKGFGRTALIQYLVIQEMAKKIVSIEAEFRATAERWKDDKIEGLIDAWEEGGLKEKYAEDPEDERAKKVFDELAVYDDQLSKLINDAQIEMAEDFEGYPDNVLRDKVIKAWVEAAGQDVWFAEYNAHRVYLATRWADEPDKRHFDNRAEFDKTHRSLRLRLYDAFGQLEVTAAEGKDLPASPPSSTPSESPGTEEVSQDSGPAAATA